MPASVPCILVLRAVLQVKEVLIVKKIISILLAVVMIVCLCTACGNRKYFDTTWSFERAIIFLPDGEKIEGTIQSWTDYDASDMLQVTIDGKTYLTHSANVILISE